METLLPAYTVLHDVTEKKDQTEEKDQTTVTDPPVGDTLSVKTDPPVKQENPKVPSSTEQRDPKQAVLQTILFGQLILHAVFWGLDDKKVLRISDIDTPSQVFLWIWTIFAFGAYGILTIRKFLSSFHSPIYILGMLTLAFSFVPNFILLFLLQRNPTSFFPGIFRIWNIVMFWVNVCTIGFVQYSRPQKPAATQMNNSKVGLYLQRILSLVTLGLFICGILAAGFNDSEHYPKIIIAMIVFICLSFTFGVSLFVYKNQNELRSLRYKSKSSSDIQNIEIVLLQCQQVDSNRIRIMQNSDASKKLVGDIYISITQKRNIVSSEMIHMYQKVFSANENSSKTENREPYWCYFLRNKDVDVCLIPVSENLRDSPQGSIANIEVSNDNRINIKNLKMKQNVYLSDINRYFPKNSNIKVLQLLVTLASNNTTLIAASDLIPQGIEWKSIEVNGNVIQKRKWKRLWPKKSLDLVEFKTDSTIQKNDQKQASRVYWLAACDSNPNKYVLLSEFEEFYYQFLGSDTIQWGKDKLSVKNFNAM